MQEVKLVSEKIYLDLKEKIQRGEYLPGVHLVESNLMQQYAVSRTTIREVLRILLTDGIVEQIPNRGIAVRKLNKKEIYDYYALMQILEGAVARKVAKEHNIEMIHELEQVLKEDDIAIQQDDFYGHSKAIQKFRLLLASYADNRPLMDTIEKIYAIASIHQVWQPLRAGMRVANMKHKELLRAIKEKDADFAESIIKDIIQGGINHIGHSFE